MGSLVRAEVAPGVWLVLSAPEGAREEPEGALPVIDVGGLPGASIALRRGFVGDGEVTLRAACVRGPSDRWAPGVEELVLGRASGLARRAVAADLDRWDAGPIHVNAGLFEQRLEGEGRSSGRAVAAVGRHLLGFVGDARDVVVCSVVCAEPGPSSKGAEEARCARLVAAVSPEGAFTEAPAPSLLVRSILLAAERPREAGALGVAATVVVVALVLARRPRPRP